MCILCLKFLLLAPASLCWQIVTALSDSLSASYLGCSSAINTITGLSVSLSITSFSNFWSSYIGNFSKRKMPRNAPTYLRQQVLPQAATLDDINRHSFIRFHLAKSHICVHNILIFTVWPQGTAEYLHLDCVKGISHFVAHPTLPLKRAMTLTIWLHQTSFQA